MVGRGPARYAARDLVPLPSEVGSMSLCPKLPARRFVLAILCVTVVAGAWGAASARADVPDPDYWTRTADSRDTVYRFLYDKSPQTIPSSYDAVAEAEGHLREAHDALSPTNPRHQRFGAQCERWSRRLAWAPR